MTRVPFQMRLLGVIVLLAGLSASSVAAQNVDAMAKWTSYTIVRYKIVGEFSGLTPVLSASGLNRRAQVTDRVEFDLDWNQQEFKLVGTPAVRNFPSTLGAVAPVANCPAPRIEGAFELMTLQAVKGDGPMAMSGVLTLETKKDLPGGAIPTMNEFGCQAWLPVAAKSEPVPINFTLPQSMSMAMPGGAPYSLTPDGKSLIVKDGGWVWTCTLTGIK